LNAWVMSDEEELSPTDFDLPATHAASSEERKIPSSSQNRAPERRTLSEHHRTERERIIEALRECNWNRVKAAELSGIPRRTFYRRLKEYGIQ
jgi:serine/threonine-protein kinase PknK